MLADSTPAQSQEFNVLILNSYHQGYNWTDDITRGIINELSPVYTRTRIYIEYMGTKWASDSQYYENLRELYKLKYKTTRFDLIVSSDNDAYDFLRRNRNEIFGEIPVVFCGVNWFAAEQLKGQTLYTGVNENADIEKNIELMLTLHPWAKHVHVLVDTTTTGKIISGQLRQIMLLYKDRVQIHVFEDVEMSQILRKISTLTADSVVLLTAFNKDGAGEIYEPMEVATMITNASNVPVYGLWDFHLGAGIVGGFLTSGQGQGEMAGRLALRILAGEAVQSIPVVRDSPKRYAFDYPQLKRFGIAIDRLPAGSRMINVPPSFYTMHKGLFWGLISGIAFLGLFVVFLLFTIHRRIKAENALRMSEAKYHTLVDNLTLGVYRISSNGDCRFIQANPAVARIFGYDSVEELMRATAAELYVSPVDRHQCIAEITDKGLVQNRESLMKRKDGSCAWININARAVPNEEGTITWIDGTIEDITGKKKLEMQLRQTQKMEALGTLAGGIAHDFNNMLTAIIGYANLVKMKLAQDSGLLSYVEEIVKTSFSASSLTRSLLAFSRKQEIVVKPVEINGLVAHFEKFLGRIIGEDVELKISCYPQELFVMADSSQIEQVLMNLATNARDAMPDGGLLNITTSVKKVQQDLDLDHLVLPPGMYVEIAVADTGEGIDEANRQKIFEPFFTTKEVGKGTGLGLSIIYGIVKQHNGEIHVYSEVGRGTTFRVYLPLSKGEDVSAESAECATPVGGSEVILLVEDNSSIRRLQREVLQQFGYGVLEAEDGEEAVRAFKLHQDSIDLILMDVIMPKKNGREVFDEVRRMNPRVRVLFTSGYTADIICRQGILEEGLHFLAKPATPNELACTIRKVLDAPKP